MTKRSTYVLSPTAMQVQVDPSFGEIATLMSDAERALQWARRADSECWKSQVQVYAKLRWVSCTERQCDSKAV